MHRQRRGFTLVEMLIALVMIALMSAIVAPRFRVTPATRARQAAQQLSTDVELVRVRALASRSQARLAFNAGTGSYTAYLDEDRDGTISGTTAEQAAVNGFGARTLADAHVTFGRGNASALPDDDGTGAITLPDSRVDFDRRGIPTPLGSGGVVYLVHESEPDAVAAVAISAAGGVRTWTWIGGQWQ